MKFRNLHVFTLNEPPVSWNDVSLLDLEHISHYHLTAGNSFLPVLAYCCCHVLFQKMWNFRGTLFKPESLEADQDPIQNCHQHHDKGFAALAVAHT